MIGCTCGSLIDLAHEPPCPLATPRKRPVNCPECGRFEGHVVTCTSWRPAQRSENVAEDPGVQGAWEGVAAFGPPTGCSTFMPPADFIPLSPGAQCWCDHGWFNPAGGFWCCGGTPGMPKYREHPFYDRSKAARIARGFDRQPTGPQTRQQESKMAAGDVVPEISKYLAEVEPFVAGKPISLLRRARDQITADAYRMAGQLDANERLINKLAAAQLAALKLDPNKRDTFGEQFNTTSGDLPARQDPWGEEAAPKTGLTSGGAEMPKTMWAAQPQIDDLDARICALERQLPAGGLRAAYNAIHSPKERINTMRELAVQMRTIIRKCVSGTTLDNTDCVLLTTILDDYFGDKAGKDTP